MIKRPKNKTEAIERLHTVADNIEANPYYFNWARPSGGRTGCGCVAVFVGWLFDDGYSDRCHYGPVSMAHALGISPEKAHSLYYAYDDVRPKGAPTMAMQDFPGPDVAVRSLRWLARRMRDGREPFTGSV